MSNLDSSKSDSPNQNLPFYINDVDDSIVSTSICMRIIGNLDYQTILSADFSQTEEQLNDQFDNISNGLQDLKFLIRSSNLILGNDSRVESLCSKVKTCEQIYANYHKQDSASISPENNLSNSLLKYVPIELLKMASAVTSTDEEDEKETRYSPLFTNHKGICRLQSYRIRIDCLVFVDRTLKLDRLSEILYEKLAMHVQAIKQCYVNYFQNETNFEPQTYHFLIENQASAASSANLIVTCVYPNSLLDDQLIPLRTEIHKLLELPIDKPLLRRVYAFQFESSLKNQMENALDKYLKNPHLSAKPSDIQGETIQSLVKGNYLYFHYMQDGINDNGWGCAYRSFQTIFSWFILQSYTKKPVPTHRQIQQALVDIGDKPKDFVGSSKWIGSMEISFCLDKMLNVECKIISVSKGSEIAEKARELLYHFDTEGTPVMIGGGVLAHTIIGVDFNEMTGDVRYLILDPHYPGGEDLKTITSKGWIGWKDNKFWNDKTYYNMCCPQRPKGV